MESSQSRSTEFLTTIRDQVEKSNEMALFSEEFQIPDNMLQLTEPEIEARNLWYSKREQMKDQIIENRESISYTKTQEELLESSLVPPQFVAGKASPRSAMKEQRSNRLYPPALGVWTDFDMLLEEPFSTEENFRPVPAPEMYSASYGIEMIEEADEQAFLKAQVWSPLKEVGLMSGIVDSQCARRDVTIEGLPDGVAVVCNEETTVGAEQQVSLSAIVEIKASHILLLPNTAEEIRERYNEAFQTQVETRSHERNTHWSRIAHPCGQLFGYMVDNRTPYGALCSASKTYFIKFYKGEDGKVRVRVSRAWFTGERNFLRAWASFFREAEKDPNQLRGADMGLAVEGDWEWRTPLGEEPKTKSEGIQANQAHDGNDGRGDDNGNRDGDGNGDGNDDRSNDRNGHSDTGNSTGNQGKRSSEDGKKGRNADTKRARKELPKNGHSKSAKRVETSIRQSASSPSEGWESPPDTLTRLETPRLIFGPCFDFEMDFIRFVPREHFRVEKLLGRGSNGDAFEVSLGNDRFAVKQFDLNKNFKSYEREVLAYKRARDKWGEYVPKPEFISASTSGNVRFLGMTLGVEPSKYTITDVFALMAKMELEFGICLQDNDHGRNCIQTKDGKLLLIDLENWDDAAVPE